MYRSRSSKVLLALVAWLIGCGIAEGQEVALSELSSSGLLAEAGQSLSVDNYAGAIPYLNEYLTRMEDVQDDRVMALMQSVRLKLGQIGAHLEDSSMAVRYLTEYTEKLPCLQPREAWKLLALNLFELDEFPKCVAAAEYALSRPEPKELPKTSGPVDVEELSKDERGGLSARQLKRIEREEKNKKKTSRGEQLIEEAPDAESDYSVEELVMLNMTLAEANMKMSLWEKCIEPYQYVVTHEADEERRGYAILQLITAYIGLERYGDAKDSILELYQTDARYNIRVNMALMSAAAALYNAEEYDSALLLYRMVLPRDELIVYQIDKMNGLRREAGLSDVEIVVTTNDAGRVETAFGDKLGEFEVVEEDGFAQGLPPKPEELLRLEESVSILISLPPYEVDVIFRCGLIFVQSGRPWEAVEALQYVYDQDPAAEIGKRAFAEMMFVLVNPLEEYAQVEVLGREFLATYDEGLTPRQVAYAMTLAYQKQVLWADVKGLLPIIERFVDSDNSGVLRYECELYFMQAIADMVLLNYFEARVGFERVLIDYPDSHQQENARYWHAMAQQFLKNFQDSYDEFTAYEEAYPDGDWLPSVVFNMGVSQFGLENYEKAQEILTRAIHTFPDDVVYSDALALRGDLYASDGLLDEAEADYRHAIAAAQAVRQDSYAVFQLVSMFDLEDRYEGTVELLYAYLERCADEADVAKATYWIGKTKINQGLLSEAVEVYKQTILDYGHDITQEGVDLIITETIKVSRRLSELEREVLLNELEVARYDTDDKTLELRLRVLIAEMREEANELGRQLIGELDDLALAPPPVLAVICDASLAQKDFSRASEILELFTTRYETSDFMRSALKLSAYGLFEEGELEGALAMSSEAQALYGTEPDLVWSQLLKGLVRMEQQEWEAAEKAFRAVLTVREWRGAPYAESMFQLGKIAELSGKPSTAFGWYQRTYFQFRAHAKGYWAAEAYLASAEVLGAMGLENDKRNTYRAMLFDRFVNTLPQAEVARAYLGEDETIEIEMKMELGESLALEEPIGSRLKDENE